MGGEGGRLEWKSISYLLVLTNTAVIIVMMMIIILKLVVMLMTVRMTFAIVISIATTVMALKGPALGFCCFFIHMSDRNLFYNLLTWSCIVSSRHMAVV